ncbi:MAG: tetratricopeptide repeat protein, partial [Candidatus Binataceae bacterium]
AMTENNLGNALNDLGERESGTDDLQKAVAAYQNALQVYNRTSAPLDWAMTENNLGNALKDLGERESGTDDLQKAVAAYQAALQERTRDRVPLEWAATENNLGNALLRLGERESGKPSIEHLQQAISAYQSALQEETRSRDPIGWAEDEGNLAIPLADLGTREENPNQLCDAIGDECEAWEVFNGNDPYGASKAANNTQILVAQLKKASPSLYSKCLAAHAQTLARMGITP